MNMDTKDEGTHQVHTIVRSVRLATCSLQTAPTKVKNAALARIAAGVEAGMDAILRANRADVQDALQAVARGELRQAFVDRLALDPDKLRNMAASVRAVVALEDPVGRTCTRTVLDDGLVLEQLTVPIGVIAAIFEARPDAVTQITALALKAGNGVVLKGGREAARTTEALVSCIRGAIGATADISPDVIGSLHDRAAVDTLLELDEWIDLVVPRGSSELVRAVRSRTLIPVLGHADGNCHIYIDRSADPGMACAIVVDSKIQYPAACNAVETVLVHVDGAPNVLPELMTGLHRYGVELRGCTRTLELVRRLALPGRVLPATKKDWRTEYGGLVLACRIVDDIDAALCHIDEYGSRHTEAIVTADESAARRFLAAVDAASVFHNASTRFADGCAPRRRGREAVMAN